MNIGTKIGANNAHLELALPINRLMNEVNRMKPTISTMPFAFCSSSAPLTAMTVPKLLQAKKAIICAAKKTMTMKLPIEDIDFVSIFEKSWEFLIEPDFQP